MTHPSDGEETRPYAAGNFPPSTSPQPYGQPATSWTPPTVPGWQAPPGNYGQPSTPPNRTRRGLAVLTFVVIIGLVGAGLWVYRSRSADPTTKSTAATAPSTTETSAPSAGPTSTPTSTAAPATSSPTTPSPAAPAASSAELAVYLPSAETLQELLLTDPLTRTADAETTYTSVHTDRPDCGGAPNVALPTAYDRSDYTAIRTQEFFTQPGPNGQDSVTQAVVAFPSEQSAKDFVSLENSRWGNCKFDLVTISNPGGDAIVRQMSSPTSKNGVLTLSLHSQMQSRLGCQRGLSSRRNIVIDVQICSRSGSAQAPQLVSRIADRITTN